MNKTTVILSIAALILGVIIYYTGWLNSVFAWMNVNLWPHVTNFFTILKSQPVFSGALGTISGTGAVALVKKLVIDPKNAELQTVKTSSQEQVNSISNQLFQASTAQTEAEKTIATLQAQITELKAEKPSDSLFESQQLVVQKQAELDQLRSDYNALHRLKAEEDAHPKIVYVPI